MADISMAAEVARSTGNQWATIIKPAYRPQLALAIIVPALQQLTGINSVIFYAPQLFSSLGKGTEAALMTTCIIGAVNVGTTIVALCTVDRWVALGGAQLLHSRVWREGQSCQHWRLAMTDTPVCRVPGWLTDPCTVAVSCGSFGVSQQPSLSMMPDCPPPPLPVCVPPYPPPPGLAAASGSWRAASR